MDVFKPQGYPVTQVLLSCFVMRDILCNGPKFEIILKFSMENTFSMENRENIIIIDRKQLFIFQMFIIKIRNWIIPFKLPLLLVTHDGGKLTLEGELSLEGLDGVVAFTVIG